MPNRREVLAAAPAALALAAAAPTRVERWGLCELAFAGPAGGNPFVDVALSALFTAGGRTVRVPGFYDGDGAYRIRFSPPEAGRWSWRTSSNAPALDGRTGVVDAAPPSPRNHGPVQVA